MKLLLDEQISGRVAAPLREAGHDVVAASEEIGLRGLDDPDLFAVAQRDGRAVVTFNVSDFAAIAGEFAERGQDHHGLVFVNRRRFPGRAFGRLAAALAALLEDPPPGGSFVVWLQGPET